MAAFSDALESRNKKEIDISPKISAVLTTRKKSLLSNQLFREERFFINSFCG